MAIQLQHRVNVINLDLDSAGITGDMSQDVNLAYVQSLVAGKIVTVDSDGFVQLCDGASDNPAGFLMQNAANFMENLPMLSSMKAPVAVGSGMVVVTDQIDTSRTFVPGQAVYAGTSSKAGLLTNVCPYLGAAATGDLKSVLAITAVAGLAGNITVALVSGGTAGSEAVSLANNILTVQIESGVSTQNQIRTALLTVTSLIATVVADNGSAAVTLNGSDSVALTGGLDGPKRVGIALSAASVAAPELRVLVGA